MICGHDAEYVAAMAWVNQAEARKRFGGDDDVPLDDPRCASTWRALSRDLNDGAGSASRIERLLLLETAAEPRRRRDHRQGLPEPARCLERRAAEVARLYAPEPGPDVITPA